MKQGMFYLPMLTFFTFLFLAILVATMAFSTDLNIEEKAGISAATLLKNYDETEKILFYLEKSIEQAHQEALLELIENQGYPEGQCGTSLSSQTIWNSCPELNIEKNYFELMNNSLNKKVRQYNSTYLSIKSESEELLISFDEVLEEVYKRSVKLERVYEDNDKLVVQLKTLKVPTETSKGWQEVVSPKFELDFPEEFDYYYFLHSSLTNSIDVNSLSNTLANPHPLTEVNENGNVLEFTSPARIPAGIVSLNSDGSSENDLLISYTISVDVAKPLQPARSIPSFARFEYPRD
jgi:hypothetical protein